VVKTAWLLKINMLNAAGDGNWAGDRSHGGLGMMQLFLLLVPHHAELARRVKRPMVSCMVQLVVALETWQMATRHL
jgi:hypothetical protein